MIMQENSSIQNTTQGHQCIITLERPKALNALNLPLITALHSALRAAIDDSNISHVVIESNMEKIFCAGGDIRALYHARTQNREAALAITREEYALQYEIACSPKPVICLLDGLTLGAGVGLALHSGYAVASEKTFIAMPEVRIGLFPDSGVSRLYAALPEHLGVYLGLTAHRLNATDLHALGLVRYVAKASKLSALKKALSTQPVLNHASLERAIRILEHGDDDSSDFLPPPTLTPKDLAWIARHFVASTTSTLLSEIEQQAAATPQNALAQQTLEAIALASPLSLVITHQLLRRPPQGLRETFTNDLLLAYFCAEHGDFYEGVRALLIDKDQRPQWRYSSTEGLEDKVDIFTDQNIFPNVA